MTEREEYFSSQRYHESLLVLNRTAGVHRGKWHELFERLVNECGGDVIISPVTDDNDAIVVNDGKLDGVHVEIVVVDPLDVSGFLESSADDVKLASALRAALVNLDVPELPDATT